MNEFKLAYETAAKQLTGQAGSPFEIGLQEIDEVTYRTFVNAPKNVLELVAPAREFGDQEFIIYGAERISFADYFKQADQLSHQLREHFAVGKGTRVALAMRNYPEWMSAWLAIISLGAIVVPINSLGGADELSYNLTDSEAELLICDQQRYDLIDFNNNPIRAIVARTDSESLAPGCVTLAVLLQDAPSKLALNEARANTANANIAGDDVAMIMYTSGTTGKPKGAVFSHRSCCQAIVNLDFVGAVAYMTNQQAFNQHLQKGLPARSLLAIPLFHVSGLYSQFLSSLRGGRALVIMHKWDAAAACEIIDRERITSIAAAPSMLLEMLQCPAFNKIDSSCLINISGAGSASPERLTQLRLEKTPEAMAGAGWGMTETGGTGSSFTGAVARAKPGASGFVHPIVDLRFCDEAGNEVAQGSPGEIWLRSPTNVSGYWKRPAENRKEFIDGWFKTGDIGYLDAEGCMLICDRAKDIVIRKGENIYPIEIENCLLSLPEVDAVAAFAVPSEAMGEELAVVVKLKPGDAAQALDAQQIQRHCATQLASFKVPSLVAFTDQPFPVNATNKVLKKQVQKQFFPAA